MIAAEAEIHITGEVIEIYAAMTKLESKLVGNFYRCHKENWMDIVKEMMQMQYHAGNLKGYLDYKQFWDFMEQKNS